MGTFLTVTYRMWHGVQSLTQNELREKVILRADGGMRSGKDVMLAAALGADEYGFGTVAMIATGCIMARVCHTNNCPVGVASQREELRARFPGAPADLVSLPPSICMILERVLQHARSVSGACTSLLPGPPPRGEASTYT